MSTSPFTRRAALYRQRLLIATMAMLALVIVPIGMLASVRLAGVLLGILLLVLAGLRLFLPVESLGALVVRQRVVDVVMMLALGVLILALSSTPNL